MIKGLDEIPGTLASPSKARTDLDDFIKGTDPNRPVSVATAEITVNGQVQRFVSVSGTKGWKADAPDSVVLDGKTYTVVRRDSGGVAPDVDTPNAQHADQKIFSHIQDNYTGQNVRLNVAVENTSASNPGMCAGCGNTSQTFAKDNPSFNVTVFEGTSGVNP